VITGESRNFVESPVRRLTQFTWDKQKTG